MKRKVAYVSYVSDFVGGAEKVLLTFLENPEVSPVLIVPAEGEISAQARQMGIPIHFVDYGLVSNIKRPFRLWSALQVIPHAVRAALQIKQIANAEDVLCIHSNGLKVHGIVCLGRMFGSKPVVCHIHDIPYTKPEKLFWRFLSLIATRIVLVSRHCWYEEKLPDNAVIVLNGMDVRQSDLPFHKCGTPVTIGFVGRIHPNKGLHTLVNWLGEVKRRGIDFKLKIRGEAAPSEARYLQRIKEEIDSSGLSDQCVFEGRVRDYQKLYGDLDVVAMLSVMAEPFGLVAIESFERGVPCIAYPSGTLPDIIYHGVTGYLAKTPEQFAESLTSLISNNETYQSIRKAAFEDVRAKYSLKVVHDKLNALYASLT